MIAFKLFKQNGSITGFEVKGHAGSAEAGRDIVCTAVSSAVYITVNDITDFFGVSANMTVEDGFLSFSLSPENDKDGVAEAALRGLEAHIRQLAEQYPRNLKVIYGGKNNA